MQMGNIGVAAYFLEVSPKAAFPQPPSMLLSATIHIIKGILVLLS